MVVFGAFSFFSQKCFLLLGLSQGHSFVFVMFFWSSSANAKILMLEQVCLLLFGAFSLATKKKALVRDCLDFFLASQTNPNFGDGFDFLGLIFSQKASPLPLQIQYGSIRKVKSSL